MTRRWLDPGFFNDERVGRLSMAERQLFAAMIANQDDDGRLKGHPAYLRSIAFPYDELTTDEVRQMRDHIAEVNPNVLVYQNSNEEYVQLKRYKRYQKPRYYHPSKFPAPVGWPFEGELPFVNQTEPNQLPFGNQAATEQHTEDRVGLGIDLDLGKGTGIGKGRGTTAQAPSPSPTISPTEQEILDRLKRCFQREWARVPAGRTDEVIPREPNARDLAQLRDLAKEISSAGGCPLEHIDQAFREAAGQAKLHISYVRAVLFDWLGIERNRSP